MTQLPAHSKFTKLVNDISRLYEGAQNALVRFAWETGRLIVEVEQDGEVRAQYGTGLLGKISEVLLRKYGRGFSESNIADMKRFYLENKIFQPAGKLTWSNHVELLRVKDPKVRMNLAKRAEREHLTKSAVRQLVREVNSQETPPAVSSPSGSPAKKEKSGKPVSAGKKFPPLKRPVDLRLNTFSLSDLKYAKVPEGAVLIDCGFFVNWPVKRENLKTLDISDSPSYTYLAAVERVVDGDTLVVAIETGFGNVMEEKLRLRGVDAPEMGTPEGEKAKRFVEQALPAGSAIVLKTSKSKIDLHGRFVVDVFYKTGCADPALIIKEGTYLNQELLDKGLAVRM